MNTKISYMYASTFPEGGVGYNFGPRYGGGRFGGGDRLASLTGVHGRTGTVGQGRLLLTVK